MKPDFDVAVIGGGPAGTSTALHLVRREGVAAGRVVVLEKARHPRDKPCAGAVSAWGLDALSAIGAPLDVPHVTMQGLRVLTAEHEGVHHARLGVVVRRSEFDASLWRRVQGDGVVALEAEPLVGLERGLGHWTLVTPARTLTARLVAACDGSGSALRKLLRVPEAARKGHLYVVETPPGRHDAASAAGLCDFDLRVAADGVQGYYWDFPAVIAGSASVSRGIYHANLQPHRRLKDALARALAVRAIDIATLRLRPFSTRPLVPGAPLSLDAVALVGEAAGIDATTGEGIAQAVLMGAMAARHLAAALRRGDTRLASYGSEVLAS
ncbi:MAG: NAD(P)/FAD-dependent oxidoreductase, partial [Myxococcota bacterium]|nr:NAD(P)/FAD-dependent oxidoreductase [Myxococcota bacterium]